MNSLKSTTKTFKIIIEYNGFNYYGWQVQKEKKTIQGEIELALSKITNSNVNIIGSGRTDAGVHALGQVASFKLTTHLTSNIFYKGLNSILPNDIAIISCTTEHENFHARFSAKSKIYKYNILNKHLPSVISSNFVWNIKQKINLKHIELAAYSLLGTHDFKSFEGPKSNYKSTIKTIKKSSIQYDNSGIITYIIEADGFLRFMVRNIVGTLIDIGKGKLNVKQISKILASRNRCKAGTKAPPQGLFLTQVVY